MAAKPRVNLRLRADLWEAAAVEAKRRGTDRTEVVETALARELGLPVTVSVARTNGKPGGRAVPGSAQVKAGVAPRPKKGTKR